MTNLKSFVLKCDHNFNILNVIYKDNVYRSLTKGENFLQLISYSDYSSFYEIKKNVNRKPLHVVSTVAFNCNKDDPRARTSLSVIIFHLDSIFYVIGLFDFNNFEKLFEELSKINNIQMNMVRKLEREKSYKIECKDPVELVEQIETLQRKSYALKSEIESLKKRTVDNKRVLGIFNNLNYGVVIHKNTTEIIYSNSTAKDLLGLSEDEILGKVAIDPAWCFKDKDGNLMKVEDYPVNIILKTKKRLNNYIVNVSRPKFDDNITLLVDAFPRLSEENEIEEIVVTFTDISLLEKSRSEFIKLGKKMESELKKNEENLYGITKLNNQITNMQREIIRQKAQVEVLLNKVRQQSITDALTQLNNRLALQTIVPEIEKRELNEIISIVIIDLNNFKFINDTFGHKAGDHLLTEFSKISKNILRDESDKIFRWGGDEFLLILENCYEADAIKVCERIADKFDKIQRPASLSYGVCEAPYDNFEKNLNEYIKIADKKMYEFKKEFKKKHGSFERKK